MYPFRLNQLTFLIKMILARNHIVQNKTDKLNFK